MNYSLAQLAAIYTVYKDLDNFHTVNCCTCGRSLHIEQINDCFNFYGHFISRSVEPKLKYHPNNTFAQCVQCNMSHSKSIDDKYREFMIYRFGDNIINELKSDDSFLNLDYAKQFYIIELIKLSERFPELKPVVIDLSTGEVKDNVTEIENPIEEQWNTFSETYKQDLDTLTKLLGMENIEYERF